MCLVDRGKTIRGTYISPYGQDIKATITSLFGYRRTSRGRDQFHASWDFANQGNANAPIYSIASGIVVAVRDGSVHGKGLDYGTHVIIQYYDPAIGPFQVVYAHLQYQSANHFVTAWKDGAGQIKEDKKYITQGDKVGNQGNTTRGSMTDGGAHLHFQAWLGTEISYKPENAFNTLPVLYGIEMTREGINTKSSLFVLQENVITGYSWNKAFQDRYPEGNRHPSLDDTSIIDLMAELMKETK
jgi:murein DD-endopeptidase MepM/ murein hydrolase activator NlpD